MTTQTSYHVILKDMIHLGDDPLPIGKGMYSGLEYQSTFELPLHLAEDDFGMVQCRTLHNQCDNKQILINGNQLENFLNPHPNLTRAWVMDNSIFPMSWLKSGMNSLTIGYSDDSSDNYLIDNFVLWYKVEC